MLMTLFLLLAQTESIGELEQKAYVSLGNGEKKQAVEIAEQIAKRYPDSFSGQMASGSLLLRANQPASALKSFDRAAELRPKQVPFMWQRGIAQYYAGEFEAGRDQFIVHREVNSNDVENAVWHFMCVTKLENFDAARKGYLPAPGDPRPPMQQVYELFQGTATVEDVTKAMQGFPKGSRAETMAGLYGELYLGIYADMQGKQKEAIQWLEKAVARKQSGYMPDVARVHLEQLTQKASSSPSRVSE